MSIAYWLITDKFTNMEVIYVFDLKLEVTTRIYKQSVGYVTRIYESVYGFLKIYNNYYIR